MKKINIKIDDKSIKCDSGLTVFAVAKKNNIFIPGLCSHPDFPPKGNCRLCLVEIKGQKKLKTSCTTIVEEGMEVFTNTERVKKARNLNIELIFSEHTEKCADCVWRYECKLLSFAEKYKILITRFKDRKKNRKTYKFANAVEFDGSQCVDCRNCLDACSMLQKINYLELEGKGANQEIAPTKNKDVRCILCGQCTVHCPVSAAQEQTHWEMVEDALKDKNKIVVAQFAPSIRVSIGEDFNLPHGKIVTEQIVTSLKELGFQYVFDVNFSADITTIIEAEELLERVGEGKDMPMITSCCPGWINYVEFYHPDKLNHITTSRSPHIHGGGAIKTYWAQKMDIKPKNIVVVSIMPCTAKKYEASRKEMKIKGHYPVDYVLTTRELTFLLKKNNIRLEKLKKTKADNPLGEYSGAAAIFGGSGGVMESALRTASYLACGGKDKICRGRLEFKSVRGLDGIKTAAVNIAGKKLRVAIVNGIGNIEPVISNLDKYDYIEVMACPGGCIGGGGQPIPTTPKIRQKRIEALYKLDKSKKIRMSYDNKSAVEIISWLKKNKLGKQVLFTKYFKKKKY